jgi:hypothetical protein
MNRNTTDARRTGNRLLDTLPPAEYDRIAEALEHAPVTVKQLLIIEGQPVEYVYFPVAFRAAASRGGPFLSVLNRYNRCVWSSLRNQAPCNSRHSVEQVCEMVADVP